MFIRFLCRHCAVVFSVKACIIVPLSPATPSVLRVVVNHAWLHSIFPSGHYVLIRHLPMSYYIRKNKASQCLSQKLKYQYYKQSITSSKLDHVVKPKESAAGFSSFCE